MSFFAVVRYYLETTKPGGCGQDGNAVKRWLQARTVGLPTAWARLLHFLFVRSTRVVIWVPPTFVQNPASATYRTPEHIAKNPDYPDPECYLAFLGKYYFRNVYLRHLRIEQFNRYLMLVDSERASELTSENTIDVDAGPDPYRVSDRDHRNYDPYMESVPAGTSFAFIMKGCCGARRRNDSRLGCSRVPLLEPFGEGRENFYQQRLLLGLAWYSPVAPKKVVIADKEVTEWMFVWDPPPPELIGGAMLEHETLKVSTAEPSFSYEHRCKMLELKFGDPELGVACSCCAQSAGSCGSCRFAVGWHHCRADPVKQNDLVWRVGSLHGGRLDIQRVLFNLHRKLLPMDVIEEKANDYVSAGLVTREEADGMLAVIRSERGASGIANEVTGDDNDAVMVSGPRRLSRDEMQDLLDKRIEQMKQGGSDDTPTDQYRVFLYIIAKLNTGDAPLRLMVQASAGTGKSSFQAAVHSTLSTVFVFFRS